MLAKKYRIERNQIQYILKKGLQDTSRLFIIRYIENKKKFNRYCITVSRKIDTKAVIRNKLRRQVYEAIRTSNNQPKNHLDIVLIPKKNILKANFEEITQDIEEIINKHG